jgi:hypothetical protein
MFLDKTPLMIQFLLHLIKINKRLKIKLLLGLFGIFNMDLKMTGFSLTTTGMSYSSFFLAYDSQITPSMT